MDGVGISYRMLETAAWADHAGGESVVGRGAERRRRAL